MLSGFTINVTVRGLSPFLQKKSIYLSIFTFFQSVTGIWALQLEDANSVALNHKYKLIAFGRNK